MDILRDELEGFDVRHTSEFPVQGPILGGQFLAPYLLVEYWCVGLDVESFQDLHFAYSSLLSEPYHRGYGQGRLHRH